MIRIEDLHKSFDGNRVLMGINLDIKRGEIFALVGGSGSGKTVLLKHVAGLFKPDRGRVLVDGIDIGSLKGKALTAFRDRLGFLFQTGALFDSMSIFENTAFALKEKTKLGYDIIRNKVFAELEHVGLSGAEQKYPSQLSGGMVKRAALARELVTEPEIMLFDEPTTGLDPVLGLAMLKLIQRSHQRLSFTGLIVTHEIPRIFQIVDGVAMLRDGKLYFAGTPREFTSSRDPIVQEFIHGSAEAYEVSQGQALGL